MVVEYYDDVSPEVACAICGNKENNSFYRLKEMMFGFRHDFSYFKCGDCDCVQILQPPGDLNKYYPSNRYYSLSGGQSRDIVFFNHLFAKASHKGRGLIYQMAKRAGVLDHALTSIGRVNTQKGDEILDVGSGSGNLIQALSKLGFRNLTGIDPYLNDSFSLGNTNLLKHDLQSLKSELRYDLIMFHHSLEHMADPLEALKLARSHLKENGLIIVRIPVVSFAFEKYGEYWYSLDPPRHFFINSPKSAEILANNAGLRIADHYFDSGPEQFIVSEAYASNIAMSEMPNGGYYRKIVRNFFSPSYQQYRKEAEKLNHSEMGDQAVFYLSPYDDSRNS